MKKRITRLYPHKTALTVSLMFVLLSLIVVLPMGLLFMLLPVADQGGQPVSKASLLLMLLLMPVFYFVASYLFVAVFAWLYNRVASMTGGIAYETSD